MLNSLKNSINAQRALLNDVLSQNLSDITKQFTSVLSDQDQLDSHLREVFEKLDHCKYVFVLDENGVQISSTVNQYGADSEPMGRDRSTRPYLRHIEDDSIAFHLSEAYISQNKMRPSVTAIQTIRDESGKTVGFLGVDFDLRELPHSNVIYEEPSQWRQIKGDPVIRDGLFLQRRVESLMDQRMDDLLSVHEALMRDQGVHHFQIHFSSSRSTIWHSDDPFVYRILTMDELSNTDICLAYPIRPYLKRAIVPASSISKILKLFKALRFTDETVYLRSASLNIVNGKVGLNFSCDGTHYLNHDEFLEKGLDFWFGIENSENSPQTVAIPDEDLDLVTLDAVVEDIAGEGCIKVNKFLYAVEKETLPELLPEQIASYSAAERDYIYSELKSTMDVYEGGVCEI